MALNNHEDIIPDHFSGSFQGRAFFFNRTQNNPMPGVSYW